MQSTTRRLGVALWIVQGLLAFLFEPSRLRLGCLLWFTIGLLGIVVQGRFYLHHYILVFPPACFLAAFGVQ